MKQHKTALAFCNSVRKNIGLEPVDKLERGIPNQARMCPISRTITKGTNYGASTIFEVRIFLGGNMNVYKRKLPLKVERFIVAFDNGKHPDLET